jgi:hypothetical protein
MALWDNAKGVKSFKASLEVFRFKLLKVLVFILYAVHEVEVHSGVDVLLGLFLEEFFYFEVFLFFFVDLFSVFFSSGF